jgi:hypothetical protein
LGGQELDVDDVEVSGVDPLPGIDVGGSHEVARDARHPGTPVARGRERGWSGGE